MMTIAQVQRRVERLEKMVQRLVTELHYCQSVEAIREGLESADRGEGDTAQRVFSRLREKLKVSKPQ